MDHGWRKRLRELIEGTPGLNMKSLSRKAGLGDSYVNDILVRGFKPTIENFVAIAEAAGVSPAWLLSGDDQNTLKIPVVGVLSGAEAWKPLEGMKTEPVDFELHDYDMVAIEVRGDSMAPVYRDQDFLIGQRRAGRYAQNLIGVDCMVKTTKGDTYVKIVQKGSRHGLFNLRSYNAAVKDVENVAFEWVAPIVWIRRGGR